MSKKPHKEVELEDRLTSTVNLNEDGTPDKNSLELIPTIELSQAERSLFLSDQDALIIREVVYEKLDHECIALIGQNSKPKKITVYKRKYGTESY